MGCPSINAPHLSLHFHAKIKPSTHHLLSPLNFFSKKSPSSLFSKKKTTRNTISATLNNNNNNSEESPQQKQLNLSVLRFTLGIPGFDESYLPRWIGVAFGSLILLNHFLGSSSVTAAQLRSEVLGLCLAGFSATIPYIGKFLKGANVVDRSILPEGNKQLFILPEYLSAIQKENFAWGSFALLKNTNTMSVLISVHDVLCVRGYWNPPDDASKADILEWFKRQVQQIQFSDLKETLYFPQSSDAVNWGILPRGTQSLLVQPVLGAPNPSSGKADQVLGFILLVSNGCYAYGDKDRAWVRAVATKFRGFSATGTELFRGASLVQV